MENQQNSTTNHQQLTLRGMIIGSAGALIITISSLYVALKLGALPWPIIFVALVSMGALKALKNTNINEINVTHTAMSAGAMVAGGVAFTIPGIWMLDPNISVSALLLLTITIGGVILGLIFTALLRRYFIETKALPYPMGMAAAETIIAGDQGGRKAKLLFASMGGAGIFTFLRDGLSLIPPMLFSGVAIPGISFGVWTSPMMISVGYIIGPLFLSVWFLGALIGDFGLVFAATHLGLWDLAAAADIKTGLGIGVMVGTGAGIIIKSILPQAKEIFSPMFRKSTQDQTMISMRWAPWFLIILAFLFTFIADLSPWASILIILGAWLTTSMSCLIVGQSGINPMEIFGVIVLLLVKLIGETGVVPLFFTAAVIAVACGLTGDVMNDFKSGHLLKTNPKNQLIAEAIGGLIGAVVSVGVLLLFVKAYGTTAFGAGGMFVAPQASMVAAMVGGIANMPAFFIGLGIGLLLYLV
ncbi:MAG: OPT/YSL family transporter, partial [Clostridiales bacterium]